jgi:hypothetical protein
VRFAASCCVELTLSIPARAAPARRRRTSSASCDRRDPEHGVDDAVNRVFGYEKLMDCDGAATPANAGVNPGLTITAVAEHAAGCPAAQPRDNLASEDPPA